MTVRVSTTPPSPGGDPTPASGTESFWLKPPLLRMACSSIGELMLRAGLRGFWDEKGCILPPPPIVVSSWAEFNQTGPRANQRGWERWGKTAERGSRLPCAPPPPRGKLAGGLLGGQEGMFGR